MCSQIPPLQEKLVSHMFYRSILNNSLHWEFLILCIVSCKQPTLSAGLRQWSLSPVAESMRWGLTCPILKCNHVGSVSPVPSSEPKPKPQLHAACFNSLWVVSANVTHSHVAVQAFGRDEVFSQPWPFDSDGWQGLVGFRPFNKSGQTHREEIHKSL